MKGKLDENTAGLILGSFVGLVHALWSVLVALGMAQPLMDWIYGLHFLNNPFTVSTFNLGTAVFLVVVTFIVGYLSGWVFATIWNMVQKSR